MAPFHVHTSTAPLSVKELICILHLLIPVTLANGNLSLEVRNFTSSEAELVCHFDYDGDMTDVFFHVSIDGFSCLHSTTEWCEEMFMQNYKIHCLELKNPKTLPFLVELNGKCDESMSIGCSVNYVKMERIITFEKAIKLTAQGNPPVIYVNDGQPVEASQETVRIVCMVTSMCYKTKLDIFVDAPMQRVSTTHTKEGSRFNTIAVSEATFSDPGNYTIVCKETGKDDHYSRNYTLLIDPSEKVTQQNLPKDEEAPEDDTLLLLLIILLSITAASASVFLYIIWSMWKKRSASAEVPSEKVPLVSVPGSEESYKEIENISKQLSLANIQRSAERVREILNEGQIIYPEAGSSIIHHFIEKIHDLYKEPLYAQMIQDLFPSYRESTLSKKEDLSEIIWNKLDYQGVENEYEANEFLGKLTIIPMDEILRGRLSWRCLLDFGILHEKEMWNKGTSVVLNTTTANHFKEMVAKYTDSDGPNSKMYSIKPILDEGIKILDKKGDILNFIIKSIPSYIIEHESSGFSTTKELIVENCLERIEENSTLCDHVDNEGRTPVHNVLEIFFNKCVWINVERTIAGTDRVWYFLSQLITCKNVNIRDKNKVTPYSWILWLKESIQYQDISYRSNLEREIEKIFLICQKKGANKEGAHYWLNILREREMGELLKRLMNTDIHTITDEAKFRSLSMDLNRLRCLKDKGCGECITRFAVTEDFEEFVRNHILLQSDKILEISNAILQMMIVKNTAQQIYDIVQKEKKLKGNDEQNVNYYAFFSVLQLCLERGAIPTRGEIYDISLLIVDECTTPEALSATLEMISHLICAFRKQHKPGPIEIYLNPLQNQWKVREDFIKIACTVIGEAYGTLDNCMKSRSVVNTLLFMSKADGSEDIRKCFERANELLQRDMTSQSVTELAEGRRNKPAEGVDEKQMKEILIKRNDNCLKRNALHLTVIFCHDEKVLNLIPKELVNVQIEGRDINGHTPLHIAHLHDNMSAIKFLESHGAKSCVDFFGNFPQSSLKLCNAVQQKRNFGVMHTTESVLKAMKGMLILPVNECAAIEKDLKELFQRMVAKDDFLNAEVVIGGSMREKLTVGNWSEFNLQLYVKSKPYPQDHLASLKIHEYLVRRITEIDMSGLSLQCVSVSFPWIFTWEGVGNCKGQKISVDFVLISVEDSKVIKNERQQLIMDNAPAHERLKYLEWNDFKNVPLWHDTVCRYEWDIMDNLPPGCRLGLLFSMALLEEAFQQTPCQTLISHNITYVLKSTLLWILAAKTPENIENKHGNVIGERYGALRQQLHFQGNDTRWMTEESLERYAGDGRFWAEKIVDAIWFMAKSYRITLGSFLESQSNERKSYELCDILDTCERCLEQLRPEVFFGEEACASSEVSAGEFGLRTRLQEVIDRLNDESEFISAAVPGKRIKEIKRLITWVDNTSYIVKNGEDISPPRDLGFRLLRNAGGPCLLRKERQLKEMDADIDKFLEQLGKANQLESELFREMAVFEEPEMEKRGENVELFRIKEDKCKGLAMKVNSIRTDCQNHLENLEQKLDELLLYCTETEYMRPSNVELAESKDEVKIHLHFE